MPNGSALSPTHQPQPDGRSGRRLGAECAAVSGASAAKPPRAAKPAEAPPRPLTARPATNAAAVPHTLAEALAATYSNQPALQAERAKLRATDENVPTALAGWRPTVVLAGTAGYGDGMTREFLPGSRQNVSSATDATDRHRPGNSHRRTSIPAARPRPTSTVPRTR